MTTPEFSLPGSSLDELKKIIMAYGSFSEKVSLTDVGKRAGLHATTVSKSAKFLVDVGLVTSGAQKSCTDLGKKLARALEHKVFDDVSGCWREAIRTNEKVSHLITTVRIKGGMTDKALSDHILYVSGASATSGNRTGARTVVDIMLEAKMLHEQDGKLEVLSENLECRNQVSDAESLTEKHDADGSSEEEDALSEAPPSAIAEPSQVGHVGSGPQVTINIQVQIPEASDPDTYEQIFSAMKRNLFPEA